MTDTSVTPRFAVDFAEAALDGEISVLTRDLFLSHGARVQLFDDEGNECPAVVVAHGKHVTYVRPEFPILRPSERVSLAPHAPEDVLRAMLRTPPSF